MQHIDGRGGVVGWILLFVMLVGGNPVAQAASTDALADFGCSAPIKVAVFEFGPWYQHGQGINVDLFDAIAQKTGCRFDLVDVPRAQVWSAMDRGDVDIIPNSIQSDERLKLARFVTFLKIRNLMIVRSDTGQRIDSPDSFIADRTGRIGFIAGFLYGSYFDLRLRSLLGDERISTVDDPKALMDLLRQGEVDAILLPSGHYFSYASEMERQTLFRILDTSQAVPQPSGFALSRRTFSPLQTDNWLRLIEAMFIDGSLESLISRRLPPRLAATTMMR